MDPTEKGWLNKYLELKNQSFVDRSITPSTEKDLYAHLQPTGILYGHPLNIPKEMDISVSQWPIKERMKVILAESLISCGLLPEDDQAMQDVFLKKTHDIISDKGSEFYTSLQPQLSTSNWKFWSAPEQIERIEKVLDKRILVKSSWNSNFWQGFFHNILIFTDVILFSKWIQVKDKSEIDLESEREKIRINALHIIACSAYADNELEQEEEKLFNYFLESAELKSSTKKQLQGIIHKNTSIEFLEIDTPDSWLLGKYYLELAILTVWADRNVNDSEIEFLEKLCVKLGLEDEELTNSLLGVESFVLNNWDRVHFLQSKQSYLILSNSLAQRMSGVASKYKNHLKKELLESKELISLLNKSRNENLSIEEKMKIREQLIDVLKTIPAFFIIALPFTFLTLPILFKILPKSVFPSSFDPNRVLKRRSNRVIDS